MKNKKMMYVLLAASAFVWGWIFVKVYHVVSGSEESSTYKTARLKQVAYETKKDTFELLANYRDPFLKRKSQTVNYASAGGYTGTFVRQPHVKKAAVKQVKVEKIINWDFIKYKGRILRQSTGKLLSLVSISGNDYSLEEGKEVQQVLLLKSYPDSIWVKFEGVKKYIKRNSN